MDFSLDKSFQILSGTPLILQTWLAHLDGGWLENNEGENTWSALDVVRHLVLAEKTNWMVRTKSILSDSANKAFVPFVRMENDESVTITAALAEFAKLRAANINELKSLRISADDLEKRGIHPEFGNVTLSQLLSTWTVHDLGHIGQISRVMARQYKSAVGPWAAYLSILNK